MQFHHTEKVQDLIERVTTFMDEHVYPSEAAYFAELEVEEWKNSRGNGRIEGQGKSTRLVEPFPAERL